MQAQNSVHPATADEYHPPEHVVDHLALHAIRNIPNVQPIQQKIKPAPPQNILMGLQPHKYNSTGFLQFGFVN